MSSLSQVVAIDSENLDAHTLNVAWCSSQQRHRCYIIL